MAKLLQFKKFIFVAVPAVLGILLLLAGLDLLQVTSHLNLYSGIILLILAVLLYFLN